LATEEGCRACWIERWGGEPACARCGSKRVWDAPRWPHVRVRGVQPPDQPHLGYGAGEAGEISSTPYPPHLAATRTRLSFRW